MYIYYTHGCVSTCKIWIGAMGHSAEFGYVPRETAQVLVMCYEEQHRIWLRAMGHSTAEEVLGKQRSGNMPGGIGEARSGLGPGRGACSG
jgi:hypothetical protein